MQSPSRGALNIDHLAHFVPQRASCREALERLGFNPTPFSFQQHRTQPDAPLTPVGSGNHCVMLRRGYLEFLVPVADTEVAAQLRSAIDRHVGAHSIVFGTADPGADHERLRREGFDPIAPIALQRPIETPDGESTARFTVVRVPAGRMQEGRIQFCQHHTEPVVWQSRWLEHANGAIALAGVLVCVEDLDEVCARYARFTGLPVKRLAEGVRRLQTERGWIRFYDAASLQNDIGIRPAVTPIIAGCELVSLDLDATRRTLESRGVAVRRLGHAIAASGPEAIGGEFIFAAP
jgi:hypothetical protein